MEKQFFHTNRQAIRDYNRHLILNIIKRKGPISQHEICQKTRIRPATVINILNRLKREKYIREIGLGKSTGGRPPHLLELNPKARYIIGIHFDGIRIRGVLTDLKGEVIYKIEAKDKLTKKNIIPLFSKVIDELIKKLGRKNKILGIGLGIPGLVDRDRGIGLLYANLPWWKDIPFKASLEKKFSLDVAVENDTRVLTLAEKWYGQGKGIKNFLYIDIGPGIGLGTFLDNRLYRGGGDKAGEFGHTTIAIDGPVCKCGRRGCLEAMASTTALQKEIGNISLEEIIDRAGSGDPNALQAFSKIGRFLGVGIVNIINIFNPSLIILGGELAQSRDLILIPVRETVKKEVLTRLGEEVEIRLTKLDPLSGAIGATTLVLEKIFDAD